MLMCEQTFVQFCQFEKTKDIEHERNPTSLKGHNSGTNLRKMMPNNPRLDLVVVDVWTKSDSILSIILKILSETKILRSIKDHNYGTNLHKFAQSDIAIPG